ncbi:MAG TPA: hypothetical protein VMU06_08720 [Stellaceae bacterium]|nr:hypothetical protein [Stellaceae bacterium]
MRRLAGLILVALGIALAGCAGPGSAPPFVSVTISPVPQGFARIYFFRDWEPYESLSRPWIRLNGNAAAISEPGGVSFRDVPPGPYVISVDSQGTYFNQTKTALLGPGDTIYVKILSLWSWDRGFAWTRDTFVVALVWEPQARAEIERLHYFEAQP